MPCSSFTATLYDYLQSDLEDLFRYDHDEPQEIISKKRRLSSPIDWLATHYHPLNKTPYLNDKHVKAADAFRNDFFSIGHSPRLTQKWTERVDESGICVPTEEKETKKALSIEGRLKRIMAIAEEHFGLLVRICCFHETLPQCERFYHLKRGSAKAILRDMLERLLGIYKIK